MYSFESSSSFRIVPQLAGDNARLIAIAGAIVAFIVYNFTIQKIRNQGRTDVNRAPLVIYAIPWVGSAIELGKDPDGLFKRATAALGPVFRVHALGRETTYITAPELINAVYRDSKTFQQHPISVEMSVKIFGASSIDTLSLATYLEDCFKAHAQYLSSSNVVCVLQKYGTFTYEALQNTLNQMENGGTTGLSFIKLPAYDAASYAFFGKTFPSRESYEPFKAFDEGFILLQTQIPHFLLKKTIQGREKLIKILETYISTPHDVERSGLIDAVIHIASRTNWSLRERAITLLGDLWPLQANVIQVAFWILALQLQRPEGLRNLVREIDTVRANWLKDNPDTTKSEFQTHWQWILDGAFPLLTSTIQEGLRYATMSFSVRVVEKDTVLRGYFFRKGDQVICNTRVTHFDEDIHRNSTEFIPDRYMSVSKFTKGERSVPNHTIPFGGGVSICGGRHFAQGALKMFIAILLSLATIEIDPTSSDRPQFNYARIGTGVLHHLGDLSVRVTRREV